MTTMAAVQQGMDSSAYSAVWSVANADNLIRDVEDQFESWLRRKGSWDPPTETSGYHVGPNGQELLAVHREGGEGRSLRLRLIERGDQGTWRTNVTVNQAVGSGSWVGLRVSNSEGLPPYVPRLASFLLEALELHDGATWLSPRPRRVAAHEVERVAEEVTDLERQGLYLVAGTDESMPFAAFADKVERWTSHTRGMAQVVVLDPEATREFAAIVGSTHDVPPWTIRTFDTEVDPAIASDGRRHRILGTRRLAGSDAAVRAILGRAARAHAAKRSLPPRFTAVDRALARSEDKLLVDALIHGAREDRPTKLPRPPVPSGARQASETDAEPDHRVVESLSDEASKYLAQVELVRELLGVDSIDRESLAEIGRRIDQTAADAAAIDRITRQLDERRHRIEELEAERDALRELSDDQELDLADALQSKAKLGDEIRWLRRRLAEQGDAEGGYGLLPKEESTRYPADFADLAEMLTELEERGVVFTGDSDIVCALVDHDPLGRLAGVAWDCLLALCDYIRARNEGLHTQGLRQYLETTPQGFRSVPRKKFAAKESAVTMAAWGDLRKFPVPVSVDASGWVEMEAHFKLGLVGMVSPRMYYLDNYCNDGKVYIGYIGSHLRNTQT